MAAPAGQLPARIRALMQAPWFWHAAGVVTTAVVAVLYARQFDRWDREYESFWKEDFGIIYSASQRLAAGGDAYVRLEPFLAHLRAGLSPWDIPWHDWPYLYPPTMAAFVSPATALPYELAARIWIWLNLALLLGGIWLAARAAAPELPWLPIPLLVFAAAAWPVRFNFFTGNTEAVVLFLFALAAWLLRRNCATAAGGALGLLTALKVFPGFALAGLLLGGRHRTVLTALTLGSVLAAAAFAWAGPGSWSRFRETSRLKTESPNGFLAQELNQSLNGFLQRHWVSNASNRVFGSSSHRPRVARNMWFIGTVCILAAYLAVEWQRRRRWTQTSLALGITTTLLLHPCCEAYYVVELLLPMAVAIAGLAGLAGLGAPAQPVRLRRLLWMGAGLALSLHLLGLRSSTHFREFELQWAHAQFWWDALARVMSEEWMNDLWVSRVWLGIVGLWACLLTLRMWEAPEGAAEAQAAA